MTGEWKVTDRAFGPRTGTCLMSPLRVLFLKVKTHESHTSRCNQPFVHANPRDGGERVAEQLRNNTNSPHGTDVSGPGT